MKKRDTLLALLALGALPFAAHAQQQAKVWRVGFLSVRAAPPSIEADAWYKAFLDGMRELGYIEGRNLVIDWRFGEGKYERLLSLAADLVQAKVDVIVTHALGTAAAQKASVSIPIVSAALEDPVASGFAASLARPGGNITGLSFYSGDFVAKFLELLAAMVPKVSRVAVLRNTESQRHPIYLEALQAAAPKFKVTLLPISARNPQEIEQGYARMSRERAGAAIILPDGYYVQQLRQLAELAIKYRVPSIWGGRPYAVAGGLMTYGFYGPEGYRRAATYVDKIFKGAKPGDLPIELPTKFELVINRKTAKTLSIAIPQQLLLQATEVIE